LSKQPICHRTIRVGQRLAFRKKQQYSTNRSGTSLCCVVYRYPHVHGDIQNMGQSAANQEAEHYPSPERAAAKQQTPHPNSLHRVFPSVLFVGGAGFLFSVRRQQQPCRLSRCTARSDHDHNQNEEDRRCPDECIPIRDNGIIHDTPSKNPKIVGTDHPALPSYRCGIDVLSRQREKTDNRIPSPWFEFDCYKGHQSTKAIGDA